MFKAGLHACVYLLLMFQEESMKDACSDEFGVIDFGGGGGGQRKRKVGMARKVYFVHTIVYLPSCYYTHMHCFLIIHLACTYLVADEFTH